MTQSAVAPTFVGDTCYRHLKHAAYPGQLRLKTWAYVVPPKGPTDPEWIRRAADYWKLQAETYGLRFAADQMHIMVDYASGCVTTSVHVAEVLPGRRTTNYVTPRVAERRVLDKVRSDEELLP